MSGHRPEAVLEMPRGRFWWCIKCSKPWPCPDAQERSPVWKDAATSKEA